MPWILLISAGGGGGGPDPRGGPPGTSTRRRPPRDLNAERYAAWRGRAGEQGLTAHEGLTGDERRKLWVAAALAMVAVACLIGFFAVS